ncbi:MAG TPA: hypothetical protein VN922_10490, partial [Bacteroidia bacterium]|nr:hypothetical protein [Bacteroidia bacterium]
SRLNIGVRASYHLNKFNLRFDDYIGIRLGCSYWHDIFICPSSYGYVGSPEYSIGAATLYKPSFQVFYGLSLFPSGGCVGFNFEIGIGTPYFGEGGITFRF